MQSKDVSVQNRDRQQSGSLMKMNKMSNNSLIYGICARKSR